MSDLLVRHLRVGGNIKGEGDRMVKAKSGDKVLFNFRGTLDDGTVFDSSYESDFNPDDCRTEECSSDDCGCCNEPGPVEIVIGAGEFLSQVEDALAGMAPGERKNLEIAPGVAFGEYDETKIFTVPITALPDEFDAEEGDEVILTGEDDEEIGVMVIEKTDKEITFDANHPLAGKRLTFALELVSIL
jgi:peptidylprolyl isomerase